MGVTRGSQWPGFVPQAWREVWDDYEIMHGRSLSPKTLANYRDTFVQLAKFANGSALSLEAIDRRLISLFLDYVKATASGTTAAMRFRGLRAVFKAMSSPDDYGEALIRRNPIAGLKSPKEERVETPVLGVEDVKRLIAACKGTTLEDARDEAMIRFLYDTGVRRGEVASMRHTADWLNLREGTAMVTGKTGPRIVAFGQKTGAAIFRYIRVRRRARHHGNPALWIGHRGPLLGNGVFQALARRFDMAGIKTRQQAHVFRHTFAHTWQLNGGSVPDLVALNGWSSGAMALRYAKSAANERAREAHRRLSPGERL